MEKIAIIGLGYVGLPLAVEFGKNRPVVGFDIDIDRVISLRSGVDSTFECTPGELTAASNLIFTHDMDKLKECSIFIITVPTPIDEAKKPDLSALVSASHLVGSVLEAGNIVIYESTVYPGVTEDVCAPVLEESSGLRFNLDFFCGYSPERVNPGDRVNRLPNIIKVTSGSTPEIAEKVDNLYSDIITAGTWKASSIKVAEAAKVIENTQRDVNIALINELSIIFDKLEIDTYEVLDAASTKWNFLQFKPGLVGGHCIGVDPYYLTHKSQIVGYHPELILAGRRLNDEMPRLAARKLVKKLFKSKLTITNRVLVLGFSFKENCPDTRNTKVFDFVSELIEFGIEVDVFDPIVDPSAVQREYKLHLTTTPNERGYSAIVLAVPHQEIITMGLENIRNLGIEGHIFFDLKGVFQKNESDMRL